jgi:Leucine-rich repeat (LRR) protein
MKEWAVLFLLFLVVCHLNASELTILDNDGTIERIDYDDSITELLFSKSKATAISGLGHFKQLRKIVFQRAPYIKNFNFLRELNSLEELVFEVVYIDDVSFIYSLPSLKRLVFHGGRINMKININRLPELEYLELSNMGLTELPFSIESVSKLKIINLAYNKLLDIEINENLPVMIIATGNPLTLTIKRKNIYVGDLFELLPPEYHQYIQ